MTSEASGHPARERREEKPLVTQGLCRSCVREPGRDAPRVKREKIFQPTGRFVLPKVGVFFSQLCQLLGWKVSPLPPTPPLKGQD